MKVDQADVDAVIEAHRSAGTVFTAAGVGSFVRSEGDGEPVVLMHGLPASSFLYRKVIPELATRGFRALSFDWPGLGLADRPTDFDYSTRRHRRLGSGGSRLARHRSVPSGRARCGRAGGVRARDCAPRSGSGR